jgi:hypothetical protein
LSVTLVVLSAIGAPPTLLRSLSVNVVIVDVLGAPAVGAKARSSSSLVIAAAVSAQPASFVKSLFNGAPFPRAEAQT